MQFDTEHDREAEVRVPTSLIDVIFLLLIFFMVTYSFPDIYKKKLDIRLPQAKADDVEKREVKKALIEMDAQGRIALNGQEVTLAELEARLKEPEANFKVAMIRADERISHGRVTQVLGLCRDAAILDIAIAVR